MGRPCVGAGYVFWQKAMLGRLEFLPLRDSVFSLFRADSDKSRHQLAWTFQNLMS